MTYLVQFTGTMTLFEGTEKLLNKGQFLILYEPFKIVNKNTSRSIYIFENKLKIKNNLSGIRNLEEESDEAKKNGFFHDYIIKYACK